MKRPMFLLFLPMIVVFMSCGGKNKGENDGTAYAKQDSVDAQGVQRMQVSKTNINIQFKGKEYRSLVTRTPDDDLPRIVDERGTVFADNRIEVRLTRGGEQVFSKCFTKQDFAGVVDSEFLSKSILEGLVFNKSIPQGFLYAASICYPQTDLYVPISITVTPDGRMSMERDELLEDVYATDTL